MVIPVRRGATEASPNRHLLLAQKLPYLVSHDFAAREISCDFEEIQMICVTSNSDRPTREPIRKGGSKGFFKRSLVRSVFLSVAAFTGFSLFVGAVVVPHEMDRLIQPEEVTIRNLVVDEQEQFLLAYCACVPRNNEAPTHYQLSTQRLGESELDPEILPTFGKPVRVHPIASGMIIAEANGTLRRVSGSELKSETIGVHSLGRIWKMNCSPDERTLLVWDFGYSAWDLTTKQKLCEQPSDFRVAVLSRNGRSIYCDKSNFMIELDLVSGAYVRQLSRPGDVVEAALSPDGRLLATLGADRRIQVTNVVDGTLQWERNITGKASASRLPAPLVVPVLKFSPDGEHVLCAHEIDDPKHWGLSVWSAHSGEMAMAFEAHTGRITGAQFAGPRTVYTWAEDCKLRKWQLRSSDALLEANWNTESWRTQGD